MKFLGPALVFVVAVLGSVSLGGCRCVRQSPDELASRPRGAPVVASATMALPTQKSLIAVWGSGPRDVWAVGAGGTIVHYDGRSWSVSGSGTTKNLSAVYGTSPKDVWVAGDDGTTLHFDGFAWKESMHREAGVTELGIWASGPSDVWIAGVLQEDEHGYMRHWDGKRWEGVVVPGCASLWEVWGSGPTDIWMVGTAKKGRGMVLRGNGKHFDAVKFEGDSLRGVWGTGPNDVWVAEYEGTLHHWDGAGWRAVPPPSPHRLLGLWGSSTGDLWTVGLDGVVLRGDGSQWRESKTGVTAALWSVWGSGPSDVWAVGGGATVIRWNGKEWIR